MPSTSSKIVSSHIFKMQNKNSSKDGELLSKYQMCDDSHAFNINQNSFLYHHSLPKMCTFIVQIVSTK
jgi:hypothetical protein